MPLMKIASMNAVRVQVKVSERHLALISAGNSARVTTGDGFQIDDVYVSTVFPEEDADTKTGIVEIIIDNLQARLKLNSFVTCEIAVAERAHVLQVDSRAVFEVDGQSYVYRVEKGTVSRTKVSVGAASTDGVEIVDGLADGDQVVVVIVGEDLEELGRLGEETAARSIENVLGLHQVNTTWANGQPEYHIEIDRRRAFELGLTPASVARQAYIALKGGMTREFFNPGNIRHATILVRYEEDQRATPGDLSLATVTTPSGQQVPLDSVAKVVKRSGPTAIERDQMHRSISVIAIYRPAEVRPEPFWQLSCYGPVRARLRRRRWRRRQGRCFCRRKLPPISRSRTTPPPPSPQPE